MATFAELILGDEKICHSDCIYFCMFSIVIENIAVQWL